MMKVPLSLHKDLGINTLTRSIKKLNIFARDEAQLDHLSEANKVGKARNTGLTYYVYCLKCYQKTDFVHILNVSRQP